MPDRPSFDLTRQPWIPVLRHGDAEPTELSVRDLLIDSHHIDRIVADPPLLEPVLLRLLLAIVIDVYDLPDSTDGWADRWDQGQFDPGPVDDYLDAHRDRFDLFDPVAPFAQVAELEAVNGQVKSTSQLMATMPSGNNVPLWEPVTDADNLPLTPAEAARWLLAGHAWDAGAIKSGAVDDPSVKRGKTTGNPVGPLGTFGVTVPGGMDLHATLLLNLPVWADGSGKPGDAPDWRRRPATAAWSTREPDGLLDLLTWRSRRIRLHHDEGIVTGCIIAAGDRLERPPADLEIHGTFINRATGKSAAPEWRLRSYRAGVAGWRHLDAILASDPDRIDTGRRSSPLLTNAYDNLHHVDRDDYPLQVALYDVTYDSNRGSVTAMVHDEIPVSAAALDPNSDAFALLMRLVNDADTLRLAADRLHGDLRKCLAAQPWPWDQGDRPGDRAVHDLDSIVRQLLAVASQPDADIDALRVRWERNARDVITAVGDETFAGFPARVYSGTDEVSGERTFRHRAGDADRKFRTTVNKTLGQPPSRPSQGAA